ncbi:MAG: orange carotenoid protein N-terminal domain-containing protein [Nodosilinea sp.]
MTAVDVRLQFEQTITSFKSADADCQLTILWETYNTLGQAFATIAPVALFSQAVQQLLNQLDQLSRDEQFDVLRDILSGANTRFAAAYGTLNVNMKLAFWHRLINRMALPANMSCQVKSAETAALLMRLDTMGLNERLHFLRRVVG